MSSSQQTAILRNGNPVNLNDLISFNFSFPNLAVVLDDVVSRLADLERNQAGAGAGTRSIKPPGERWDAEALASPLTDDEKDSDMSLVPRKLNILSDRISRLEDEMDAVRQKQDLQDRRLDSLEKNNNNNNSNNNNTDHASWEKQLEDTRLLASRALAKADDAEHLAETCASRLQSHLRSPHGGASAGVNEQQEDNGTNNSDNNNNTSSASAKPSSSNSGVTPSELADEQERLQREIDRLAKLCRDNQEGLEAAGGQIRSLQRQGIATPPSRGGGGGMDLARPLHDLTNRVAALEEDKEKHPQSPFLNRSNNANSNNNDSDALAKEIQAIHGHLTTHDVAIEDLQRQAEASLLAHANNNCGDGGGGGAPKEVLTAAVTSVNNRVKQLEDQVKDHDNTLRGLENLKNTAASRDDVDELKKNVDYLQRSSFAMNEKLSVRLAALEEQVKQHLEKPHVDLSDFERLQGDVRRLESELQTLANSATTTSDENNKQGGGGGMSEVAANMLASRMDALQSALDDLASRLNDTDKNVSAVDAKVGDANTKLNTHANKIQALESMVRRAADEAAHSSHDARTAGEAIEGILKRLSQLANGQDHLTDRLNHVDHAVTGMAAQAAHLRPGGGPGGAAGAAQQAKFESDTKEALDKIRKWIDKRDAGANPNALSELMDKNSEQTKGQLVDIKATIDHIHHTKADAAQVAGKADRDYVENALEKLMREIENVINGTNAGLIDTLDKSLGLLRDMIDGKATKQDVAKVRNMIGASDVGPNSAASSAQNKNSNNDNDGGIASDGLLGVTSYRCLGCNRTVEHMRPRPMGNTMSNFMARVPPGGQRPPGSATTASRAGVMPAGSSSSAGAGAGGGGGLATSPLLIPAPPSSAGGQQHQTPQQQQQQQTPVAASA